MRKSDQLQIAITSTAMRTAAGTTIGGTNQSTTANAFVMLAPDVKEARFEPGFLLRKTTSAAAGRASARSGRPVGHPAGHPDPAGRASGRSAESAARQTGSGWS